MHLTIHVVFTHPSDRGYDTEWLTLIPLMGMGNASLLSKQYYPVYPHNTSTILWSSVDEPSCLVPTFELMFGWQSDASGWAILQDLVKTFLNTTSFSYSFAKND
jgi:hypothetical protein